ncbi:MAG: exodeoxyribonuclease VII small subunit [Bacillota bacterium]
MTATENCEKPSFEEALERLEEIAARLDAGGMTLDESLELFEEAIHLVRISTEILGEAEGRIEELIELNDETLQRVDLELGS